MQHGITQNRLETLFYGNVDVDLFVSGSQIEFDYLTNTFCYPEGIIKYTGLCRYDNLLHFESKKQILIMPTFRMYIDMTCFEESDYFKAYSAILENTMFHDLLEKYNYTAVFYPHYAFQSKIASFHKLDTSNRVIIADMTYDVQQLLKDSEILITDYSSAFFDMMYMNKPVVFYQFDYERFTSEHYKSGYLDYTDVGPVVEALPNLLYTIEDLLQNKGDITSYQSYYDRTFTKRDTLNCKRVYDAIIQC